MKSIVDKIDYYNDCDDIMFQDRIKLIDCDEINRMSLFQGFSVVVMKNACEVRNCSSGKRL